MPRCDGQICTFCGVVRNRHRSCLGWPLPGDNVQCTIYCILNFTCVFSGRQNRSTEGCSKLKRSVDMTSSGKNGAKVPNGTGPGVRRSKRPLPDAMFY